MAEEIKYKIPGEKTVKFLYDGVIAFYPETAKDFFRLGKVSLPFHETWGGFKRLDFLEFALNTTGTETVDGAAETIYQWKSGQGAERTVPDKLDELVSRLEEEEEKKKAPAAKQAAPYEKQRLVKEALLESQRAKEAPPLAERVAPATTRATTAPLPPSKKAPAAPPAGAGAGPSSEPFAVGINITPEAGKAFQKFTSSVASLPVRAAIAFSAPTVAQESGGEVSSALTLWAHGIKAQTLEKKASDLDIDTKQAKRINEIVKAIKGIETSYSLQTRIIQRSFPIRDITLLLGPETGVAQAQIAIFFNPPEAGGTIAVPRRGFFGNLLSGAGRQLFGKISSRVVKGLASKASSAIAGEAAGVTTGAEAGAIVGGPAAPVTAIVGAILGWLASKIPDALSWLKRNAKEFGVAAVALLGAGVFFSNPILIISGLGLGAISLGAGGLGSLGAGVAGFGQAAIGGLTSVVLPAIGIPVLVGLLSVPVIVAIILFIINSGAYVVPPRPLGTAFGGPPVACSDEKGPVEIGGGPKGSSSSIANRAWQITHDLYQGFWCYWNRSPGSPPHPDFPNDVLVYPPGYPELFDYSLFRTNPNPASRYGVGNLFWCTWLPVKAYGENGNPIGVNIYSPDMYNDFRGRGKIVDANQASPKNVKPGAVVFFDVDNSENRIDHVAVVYEVNTDGVKFVQSNAPSKSDSIPFGKNGLQNLPGIKVVAIGNP